MTTYFDFQLDTDGDLAYSNIGQFTQITGQYLVAQRLKCRFGSVLGDWVYDSTWGIDYINQIFVKNPNFSKVRAILIEEVVNCPGVRLVKQFDLEYDQVTSKLYLTLEVLTDEGVVISAVGEQSSGAYFLLLF